MASLDQQKDVGEKVGTVLSSTEQFLEKYKNYLIYGVVAILLVTVMYFGYKQLYLQPLQEEAQGQMYVAEQYFRMDSLSLALHGDGNNLGFLQIIEEYGNKAGDVVYFYAGLCQYHLGDYEGAIGNLRNFEVGDEILAARALCCIGDAYVALENYTTAIDYFLKAANYRDNAYSARYLLRAGLVYETLNKPAEAMDVYQRIKNHYGQTTEGREVDKYIGRINSTL
ncbi:MAG: tetratricopeptide repeat protein [Prevotellaceae bacterium]|jgi:tetratricopeptide (TPR) repeat protein|nr:tetratricopeptide repeat protein [Prevotellaceae bacterium]